MSRLSRKWSTRFRPLWLLSGGLAMFAHGHLVCADDSVRSSSSASVPALALLEYQETPHSVVSRSVSLATRSAPFKKEPPLIPGKTIRGMLNIGGGPSNAVPFIWQRDAGKLYLDLNHNGDLSDDSNGVFLARAPAERYYQTFAMVHLPFRIASETYPLLANLVFQDTGLAPYCMVELRSFWQGRLTLQGRDWQIGLIPTFPLLSLETGQMLFRSWTDKDKSINAYSGSFDTFPFSRKLFINGRAYQLTVSAASKNGQATPALQLVEQPVPLGELKISGQFIRRLMLPDGPFLVVLDWPDKTVKIPAGSYGRPNVRLEHGGTEAVSSPSQTQSGRSLSVQAGTPAALAVGGPLTNSVTATRNGRNLQMEYRLIGAGGETYQLVSRDYSKPPGFAIYKDEKKIASGKFEFG